MEYTNSIIDPAALRVQHAFRTPKACPKLATRILEDVLSGMSEI